MKKLSVGRVSLIKNSTGYVAFSNGEELHFQNGVVEKNGVNGVQVDEVIRIIISRMEYLNGLHHDRFNVKTIEALKTAKDYQDLRTLSRKAAKVEGTEKDWNPEY